MRAALACLIVLAASSCATTTSGPGAPRTPSELAGAGQLVVVRSASWAATSGELRRYERSAEGGWTAVGAPVPVMLGKGGLGWGRGLHGEAPGEPSKREGDGRAPAGAFALGPVFGAAAAPPAGTRMGYLPATATLECVDDVKSSHYNELLDAARTAGRDWGSSEQMRRKDELYELGLVVDHNAPPARPGAGSCIFLHVWKGPGATTVGCTSMAKAALTEVLVWLDPGRSPLLVQLPEPEYERLREAWGLP